jgi:hypothetical protein
MTAYERYLEVKNRPDEKLLPEYKAKANKLYDKYMAKSLVCAFNKNTRGEGIYRRMAEAMLAGL